MILKTRPVSTLGEWRKIYHTLPKSSINPNSSDFDEEDHKGAACAKYKSLWSRLKVRASVGKNENNIMYYSS